MDELKELTGLVTPSRLKHLQLIGLRKDRAFQLYELISKGKVACKDDAIKLMYGESSNSVLESYRVIKNRLTERLINSVLCLSEQEGTEIQKAHAECCKKEAAVKVLRGKGKRLAATQLAEETIKKAMKFDFTDIVVSLATGLQLHYSILGDKKKYKLNSDILKRYLEIERGERLAQQYFCDLRVNFGKSKSKDPELNSTAKQYANELEKLSEQIQTQRFILYSYNVLLTWFQLIHDNNKIIEYCKRGIAHFESLPYDPPVAGLYMFYYQMIPVCIIKQEFKEAEEAINKCLELSPAGTYSHLVTLQYKLMQAFHSGQFQQAYEVILKALPLSIKFDHFHELWLIYEAYANLFIASGKIEAPKNKFRVGRFLNQVPTFSKDKRGMNINILTVQILFLLQQGKRDEIIDKRIETLKNYSTRYLRKDSTFRSNCFIKMLMLLPRSNFNKIALERNTKDLFQKLQSVPISVAEQSQDLEVVPYEVLWGEVLRLIEK